MYILQASYQHNIHCGILYKRGTAFFFRITHWQYVVKLMFSKKATKIDEIFTADLTVTSYVLHTVKLAVKILSIFVAFSENVNFTGKSLRKE